MTLDDLFNSYFEENQLEKRTLVNYRAVQVKLQMYAKYSGEEQADLTQWDILGVPAELRRERIKGFQDYVRGFLSWIKEFHNIASATRRNYFVIIRTMVNHAKNGYGIMLQMPKEPRAPKHDAKLVLSDLVVRHILTMNPGKHWGVLIAKLALYTCWRINDLLAIETDDIQYGTFMGQPCMYITRMTKKTKKIMKTPVPVSLIREIMRRYHVSPGEKLLKHPAGLVLTDNRCVELVRAMLNSDQFLRSQTVTGLNVDGNVVQTPLHRVHRPMHLFRSAGASYLIQRGMTPESVARWFTGHENKKVLNDYYVTTDNFTGAKELFQERFILPHLKDADKLQNIFDNYDEPQKVKGKWLTS